MSYLGRHIDRELIDLLPEASAIAIDGAKGVGKTATASRRADVVLSLDSPDTRQLVEADTVRQVDDHAPTRFLFTGSAGLPAGTGTHSGAVRILSLCMRPLSLAERGTTEPSVSLSDLFDGDGVAPIGGRTEMDPRSYAEAICSTGFPWIHRLSGRLRRSQIDGYISRVIDRDIADAGFLVRKPGALRAW
ncbi:hypothetical protein [Corynebacterium sp.]|uniref:hypothetical protein n=1 Tax=Corynebacterium sp. TaxID=1720 RepID=UPI003B3AD5FA